MAINEWKSLATLAKAVELGSLRRAAAALGVSPQAASQTLAQLEAHLGVRLLHRTTRQLSLTEAGEQLLATTQPALATLERALQRVRGAQDDMAGPLRIVGPHSGFAPLLWPVIDAFCQQHPDVQPDVQLDDRIGNWVQDRVDVGFRIGAPPDDGLIARRLFPVQLLICAAPSYIARWGAPASLEALAATHRCSVFRHPATGQPLPWFVTVDGRVQEIDLPAALSTNHAELELHATLSGQVIAQLAGLTAAAPIRAGQLVPLLNAHATEHMSVHLYYGSRQAQPRRVRAFIDFAIERLSGASEWVLSAQELAAAAALPKARAARKRPAPRSETQAQAET